MRTRVWEGAWARAGNARRARTDCQHAQSLAGGCDSSQPGSLLTVVQSLTVTRRSTTLTPLTSSREMDANARHRVKVVSTIWRQVGKGAVWFEVPDSVRRALRGATPAGGGAPHAYAPRIARNAGLAAASAAQVVPTRLQVAAAADTQCSDRAHLSILASSQPSPRAHDVAAVQEAVFDLHVE